MNESFHTFLENNKLKLKKVVEGEKQAITLFFDSDEVIEKKQLEENLKPYFPFVSSLHVIVKRENENKDFSLKKWQEKKLKEKEEEIKKSRVEPEKKVDYSLRPGEMLLGKNKEELPRAIEEIDFSDSIHESGVALEGDIFNLEIKDISEKSELFTFALTDYSGSIYVKFFNSKSKKKQRALLEKYLTPGHRVFVYGSLEYDDFLKDRILKASSIKLLEPKSRKDEAEEKRIELHAHTQYSANDGVSKAEKLIKRALDFGHEAIGITDHGVLQAYPELQKLSEKNGIKVLYGLEGNLIDTGIKIVEGEGDCSLDDEFVYFDLETTGTSIYSDKVIEVAAVRVKGERIIDSYQTFVNIGEKLRRVIIDLTGITDEMLADGVSEDEAFSGLLDFIGESVIAAHNARFDTAFLNRWLEESGREFKYTVVDTLPLARALVPEIGRFNMNRLCKFFKIKNEHAHRAIDDAIASSKVMDKLFCRAKEKGVERVSELNSLISTQTMALKSSYANHVTIYAKNKAGLHDLYELVSDSHLKYFKNKPQIPKEVLDTKRDNLLIGSACSKGEIFEAVLDQAPDDVLDQIGAYYDFLEVQPIDNNRHLLEKDSRLETEDLKHFNERIIKLGERLQKIVVATGDVHFVDPEDGIFRKILKYNSTSNKNRNQAPLYYRTTEEMLSEFSYLGKDLAHKIVVENPKKIAAEIESLKPIPDGTFPPEIEGAEEDLRSRSINKAHQIYGENLPEVVESRMNRELDSIINNGYAVLYIIAQKLVKHSRDAGYLVGSRGSVGSSLIAFLCDITEVNSLPAHYVCPKCHYFEMSENPDTVGPDLETKNCPQCGTELHKDGFDIPFETFLGFHGDKEPDIDLNFSGENQGQAHAYTEVLFGKDKTFRAGTISTIQERTAFGYVKNYFDETGTSVSRAEIERLKIGCEGIKRTTGQHPGGIIVVPKDRDIYEFTPIQHPADDQNSGVITTHFDYHSIEGRLLKLDILGHDDPTILRQLELLTGVNPTSIPLDDKDVISLFQNTESLKFVEDCPLDLGTSGVPEFGTSFVKQMVREIKPTDFSDLIRISGLSHGTDVWTNNAQLLIKNNVADIKNVICTRDDIMLGLINMGLEPVDAFSIMEHVRKGKGLTGEEEKLMREKKIPSWYIDSCKRIGYMFPKAHAVAYVIMAFRIAWFKVNYPLEYYATFFSIRAKEFNVEVISGGLERIKEEMKRIEELNKNDALSNKDAQSLVSLELALEMYCRGFECRKVDLRKSHYCKFLIEDNALIPPFTTIPGLGEAAAESLYNLLKRKKEVSQDEILKETKITKTNLSALEEMGCLEGIPVSDQMAFF